MKITKKKNIQKLLMDNPELAEVLLESGIGCIGCPMAREETLAEGCKAHGMKDKEIDDLISKMNEKVERKK